jgi:hypothetical protein
VRNNRIAALVNDKLNHLKLELSTFLEQKQMNCTAVDKSEMSSLYDYIGMGVVNPKRLFKNVSEDGS